MLIDIMLYYKSLRCYIIKRKWNKEYYSTTFRRAGLGRNGCISVWASQRAWVSVVDVPEAREVVSLTLPSDPRPRASRLHAPPPLSDAT